MTNSGVPQFPQPGQYRPETQQRSAGKNDSSIGTLERAPDEIRAEITARRKAIRLEGEITRVNKDGSVRVQTPRGEVDVKLPNDDKAPRPKVGQRVEVEVQPPSRNAPEQPPQIVIRPAPQDTDSAQINRQSATPVQVEVGDSRAPVRADAQIVRPAPADPNAPPPPNRFPEAGSLARLEPISPQQIEQLITSKQLIITETVRHAITPPPVLDVLPARPDGTVSAAVQASPPAPQQPLLPQAFTTNQGPATDAFALQGNAVTQKNAVQILDVTQRAQGQQGSQAAPSAQTSTLPSIQNTLSGVLSGAQNNDTQIQVPILTHAQTRAQAAVAQLQALAPSTSTETPAPAKAQDVRIGQIHTPQVLITPPAQGGAPTAPIFTPDNNAVGNPIISSQKSVQISGTVIAKTNAQVPIVQLNIPQATGNAIPAAAQPIGGAPLTLTQEQTFILQFPSDALIIGSRIDVTPQPGQPGQSLITAPAGQGAALSHVVTAMPFANIAYPQPWPAMQEIQQTLLQQTTQTTARAAQAFTASIPSPANSAQFGAAALFFVAAARGGDLGSWLGDKASEILRSSGKSSLLSRLSGDIGTGRPMSDAPSSEWRGMHIPLLWNGDIQKVALHYKHDGENNAEDSSSGNKGTRFIFDLNLDAMGKVQVDGFFRPVSSDGPRLDIVLRTEERFSSAMQAEMRRVYMDAIKPSQVGGELSFQDGSDAWVMIDAQNDSALGVSA